MLDNWDIQVIETGLDPPETYVSPEARNSEEGEVWVTPLGQIYAIGTIIK